MVRKPAGIQWLKLPYSLISRIALAVFVRESRKRFDRAPITNTSIVQRESDSSCVESMLT